MAAVTAFVVWHLHPDLILSDTTVTQGDLSGHMHEAAYLRDHLLPHGRLSGWSQDWFTGYPSLTFYFPLGNLLMVALDLLLPFNVAVKLVAAAGPIALPLCAYAFGRLNGCDRPTSACLGVAVLPLLLQRKLYIAGGTIASVGGGYAFALSMALGLLVLGYCRAGLRNGRHRALTAGLLAATALLHVIPAVVVGVGIVVATMLQGGWARLRWSTPVMGVAAAVVGFWALPFALRGRFTGGGYSFDKAEPVLRWLFGLELLPMVLLAVIGIVSNAGDDGERKHDSLRWFFLAMTAASGLLFALAPSGQVWNGRFLPMWWLWLSLLAGYGVSRLAAIVDAARRRRARGRPLEAPALARLAAPVVLLAALLPLWETRLLTGPLTGPKVDARITPRTFFEGYEHSRYAGEFRGYIDTVRKVGREHGCGRAHWERDEVNFEDPASAPGLDPFWTEDRVSVMWLTPYWTDGCIPTSLGLYVESSATNAYVDAANTRLSSAPFSRDREGPYDIAAGVADLRMLGVRYFIASRPETQQAADASPDLRPLAQTKPYDARFWKIYEVTGVEVVEPLRTVPVVVPGIGSSRASWQTAATEWFDSGDARDVLVAADGPSAWPRSPTVSENPPRRPVPEATVSRVRIEDDRVSFDVSRTGVPILVKVSWFPNWKASGAEGPWRVAPNQMVVVPTSRTVTLRYGRTSVEYAGGLATLVGIGGLALLARRGPLDMPEPTTPAPDPTPAKPKRPSKPRKKRRS